MRVAINGFGRIGRAVFRIMSHRDDTEVVAINDLYDPRMLAYLLKYDTVMGPFARPIDYTDDALVIDGRQVRLTRERDPRALPWKEQEIDLVIEATGVFRTRDKIQQHLEAGAGRVILTVPPKDDVDAIVVLGVNDEVLAPEHRIVSNASCTTNCLAPVAKVLHDSFGIERGFMTTVHAYTNDQRLADVPHKDHRRARAAALNIIPTTTGAARAVGKVLPDLAGKLDGMAMRVPVPDGSVVDLVVELSRDTSAEEINAAMAAAAAGPLKDVLEYTEEERVSSDIIGNPHSSIFDALSTRMVGPRQARVLSWYDNEWGYSHRVVDLAVRLDRLAG
ncbi:MAG: type I glyceraldehyde-3-phosphate dehydrogenase [Acidobacteriota bacterium]|nr:type I glyceraldehyde-3-phosphate dehydrogenase [Acidobacteriota bacterium]MDQ7087386.1 type I glyceraldehyde-3-phosphate dehydrogenase [Acidobacteriota bacterium]